MERGIVAREVVTVSKVCFCFICYLLTWIVLEVEPLNNSVVVCCSRPVILDFSDQILARAGSRVEE